MTEDQYKDLLQRVERLEANSYVIMAERKAAREAAACKLYTSWITNGDYSAALGKLLSLSDYDRVQCLRAWSYDQQVAVLSVADEQTRDLLCDRAGFGPALKIEAALAAEPDRTPAYVKVHAPDHIGWIRRDVVVTKKAGKRLRASGFTVANVEHAGYDAVYKPDRFSPGAWKLFTTQQLAVLMEDDPEFPRAVEDGLRVEHLSSEQCRQIAIQRGEILPRVTVKTETIEHDEPDRWELMAARYTAKTAEK